MEGGDQVCVLKRSLRRLRCEWGTGLKVFGRRALEGCWQVQTGGGDEEVLVNLRVVLGVKQSGLVTQNVVDQSPHRTVRARSWH